MRVRLGIWSRFNSVSLMAMSFSRSESDASSPAEAPGSTRGIWSTLFRDTGWYSGLADNNHVNQSLVQGRRGNIISLPGHDGE